MKKLIATLMALTLALTLGLSAALAESSDWSFTYGIKYNDDMPTVMEKFPWDKYEIENEHTKGAVTFSELEYKRVTDEGNGLTADIKYLFVGNCLVAIHYDFADGTSYDAVKAELEPVYGAAVPFNAAKIGNGKYAVDDDGELEDCKEMIEKDGVIIVLEKDHDGDVDVTFLDMAAAYINN